MKGDRTRTLGDVAVQRVDDNSDVGSHMCRVVSGDGGGGSRRRWGFCIRGSRLFGCLVGVECFLLFGWETHPRIKEGLHLFLSQMRLLIDSKYTKMEIDFRAPRVGAFFWVMLIA